MKIIEQISILSLLVSVISCTSTDDRIRRHGYASEKHHVQTKDGYILRVFRVLPSRYEQNSLRPTVFLQHGLLSSSDAWVLNGPGLALPYILVDKGYDVWLGNCRGNTYSRRHTSYSPYSQSFWNFDWHEIAIYDMPAMIAYVLHRTNQKALHYVGHSQGTTVLLVMTSLIPIFNEKIKSAQLLAPVAFMDNIQGTFVELAAPFLGLPNGFVEHFGSMELLPDDYILRALKKEMCGDQSITKAVCNNFLFQVWGWSESIINKTLISDIIETHPAGASVNQVMHYLQEYISGEFQQFDYGYVRNLVNYRQLSPPHYNLKKVKVPVFLYYADNDDLSNPVDVHRLMKKLPNVKLAYRVPDPNWDHVAHLWGNNVKEVSEEYKNEDPLVPGQLTPYSKYPAEDWFSCPEPTELLLRNPLAHGQQRHSSASE